MNPVDICILACFIISIIFLTFIWFIYQSYRISIKHPNSMFFIIVTFQILEMTLLTFQIIYFDYLPQYSKIYGPAGVMVTMYLSKFTKICLVHYMASIIIEILIKLKKSLRVNYYARIIFFHSYNLSISCLFTIIGRYENDQFLKAYPTGRLVYSIYMICICLTLIIMITYFYISFFDKIKSKDFISLTILIGISIIIAFIQVGLGLFQDSSAPSNKTLNIISFTVNSLEGIVEFIVLLFSDQMKLYFIDTFLMIFPKLRRKRQIMQIRSISLALIPEKFALNEPSSGFFSDVFENITTSVGLFRL